MPEQVELSEPLVLEQEKFSGYGWESKILNKYGAIVYRDGMEEIGIKPLGFSHEELRRIVACLNTLEGVDTKTLEYGHLKSAVQDWVKARRECQQKSN